MMQIRHAEERGRTAIGWLDSRHSFSFGDYYEAEHEGFRSLRVLNDDVVAPGQGFGMHPHRDMEIVTVVLSGALQHKDSLGSGSVIRPGDVQRMSAGTGILHSEWNASQTEPVHFLQIWLLPERRGIKPGYQETRLAEADKRNRLRLIAARDGRDGSVAINQDADIYATHLIDGGTVRHELRRGRHAWVQVALGDVTVNGHTLQRGDGLAVSDETTLELTAPQDAEVLVFDLA
jgi:redox-sensitive bicupin YhaK (pirin superfamily)